MNSLFDCKISLIPAWPRSLSSLAGYLILWIGLISASSADERLPEDNPPLTRIAFGSCADQHRPCPIWQTIGDYQPDLLLLLGDTVYADVLDGRLTPATPARIQQAYDQLARDPGFTGLRDKVPMLAIWDDHDFGNNDAGSEWEHKRVSAEIFHDFFGTPDDSPLRQQTGVYQARIFGPVGQRVQVIMLDTRYFRSSLTKAKNRLPGFTALPYLPQTGPTAKLLGDAQWDWLEQQLRQPAEIRLLASSIQVLSNEHPFEKWGNFPEERARLFELIRKTGASGLLILSGDRHLGDISVSDQYIDYPLYDITASGFNQGRQSWRVHEPNPYRVAGLPYGNHFGAIEIDWSQKPPRLKLQLRHEDGEIAVQAQLDLDQLQAPLPPAPVPPGVLNPLEALQTEVNEQVTVQFRVLSGREIGNLERIYLNSEKSFQNSGNFAVVLNAEALKDDWETARLETFLNRTIRVSGPISMSNQRKQLSVSRPDQITLVPENQN